MLPAVALLGVGDGGWRIPVPVLLLWPLFFVALAVAGLVEAVASGGGLRRTRALWAVLWELHGLRLDVETATGRRVRLWLL
jgi:hypothetical protein